MSNNTIIVSNNIGPNGEPADRIYGGTNDRVRLIQADYTEYKGNIKKKRVFKESSLGNYKITTHIYVTDDERYFDNGGMPILKPTDIEEESDETTDTE
jgi:hypothetical protein